jgi:hypothetical protein
MDSLYSAKLRAESNPNVFKRHSLHCTTRKSAATAEIIGRPQHTHIGPEIFSNVDKHCKQMGTRLAVSSVEAQIRHGAGKTTEARASQAFRSAERTATPEARPNDTAGFQCNPLAMFMICQIEPARHGASASNITVGRVPAFPGTRCNTSPRAPLPAASD